MMANAEDVVANAKSGVEAVVSAWVDPGPGLAIHYKAKRNLYENWPTLALAVERLVSEQFASSDRQKPVPMGSSSASNPAGPAGTKVQP